MSTAGGDHFEQHQGEVSWQVISTADSSDDQRKQVLQAEDSASLSYFILKEASFYNVYMTLPKWKWLSHVWLFETT